MVFEFSIDLEVELTRLLGAFSIRIPEAVVLEIEMIAEKGKGKQRKLAQPALQFIDRYQVLDHKRFSNADDALINLAMEYNAIVVTNDKVLRERLEEKKVSRIFLRGKQQLILET